MPPGKPFYGWVAFQIDVLRVGDVYLVALLGELTRTRSYALLTSFSAFWFGLLPASTYLLARRSLRMGMNAALLTAGLIALSNLLIWPVFDNFLSQSMALSFFPVAVALATVGLQRRSWRSAACFALVMAGLVSVYPVYAVNALLVAVAFSLLLLARETLRSGRFPARRIVYMAEWAGVVVVVGLVVNPIAFYRSLAELDFVSKLLRPDQAAAVGAGNIWFFPPPGDLFGLIIHANTLEKLGAPQMRELEGMIATAIVLALMLVGFRRLRGIPRLAVVAFLGVTVLLALQQRYLVNRPTGYAYGYFKVFTLIALASLPLVSGGLLVAFRRPRLRIVTSLLAAGLILLNGFNLFWTINYVTGNRVVVTQSLLDVWENMRAVDSQDWTLVDIKPGLAQHWLGYLLKEYQIRYRAPLFTQNVADHAPAGQAPRFALIERELDTTRAVTVDIDEPWYLPDTYAPRWGNDRFELRSRTDSVIADLRPLPTEMDVLPGDQLAVAWGSQGNTLNLGIAGREVATGTLLTAPQTIQIALVVPDGAKIRYSDTEVQKLGHGVWLVDVDAESSHNIEITNEGSAPIYLYRVQALDTATGDPAAPVEITRREEGAALVNQRVEGGSLVVEATVVRPDDDDEFTYQLGLDVLNSEAGKLYAVMTLDFEPTAEVQRGVLTVDLLNRTAQGKVDGQTVPVEVTHMDIAEGDLEVQTIWWRTYVPGYLGLTKSATFHRNAGTVTDLKTVNRLPIQFLPRP